MKILTSGKEGKYQHIMKKIDLSVVPRFACQGSLRTTRLGSRFLLHDSFICAGGEQGKDTCKVNEFFLICKFRFNTVD